MRIAALSDIHANLEALLAVLAHLAGASVDAAVCLGDFVGYGPDPNACVEQVQSRLQASVCGNHDLAALGAVKIDDFNLFAQEAIVWTQREISEEVRAFLAALPRRAEIDGLLLVHGSPRKPPDEYITDTRTARASFIADGFRIALVGHTHQPALFEESNNRVRARGLLAEVPVSLSAGAATATLHRVAYPIEETQRKMEAAGLPVPLIERLALGR